MLFRKIKSLIKLFVPYGIVILRRKLLKGVYGELYSYENIRLKIKNYFLSLSKDDIDDPEIIEIIDYFGKYGFSALPYEFTRKQHASDIDVFFDKTAELLYVMHRNKRLYFPKGWSGDMVRNYYIGIPMTEDEASPHCYEADGYIVEEGNVIVDAGAAEGFWALNYAEKAGEIYLFECDQQWINALRKTFEPWKQKVTIVNKYISNIDDGKNVTLDSFFRNKNIDFIKADIEGMETKLLEGAKSILSNNNKLKLLLCTYHRKNDATEIKEILESYGFTTEYTKGYLLFMWDKEQEEPYVRRGVIRGKKIITKP